MELTSWSSEQVGTAIAAAAQDLGFSQLTSQQSLVLHEFLSSKDVFVCLPTGSGKSLCYWVLPGAFDKLRRTRESIVLVVSPLMALMKDQVANLKARGVKAVYVGEKCDMDRVYEGSYPIVFISPEALLTDSKWRDVLVSEVYQRHLMVVVVDEAHCVKKWWVSFNIDFNILFYLLLNRGDSFRRAFSRLSEVRSIIPNSVKLMALTATATKSTRHSICRILGMTEPSIVAVTPNRSNICYSVEKKAGGIDQTFAKLVDEIREKRVGMPRVIVFCRS